MDGSSARKLQPVEDRAGARRAQIREDYRRRRKTEPIKKKKPKRKRKNHEMYTRVMKGSKSMPSVYRRENIFFLVENERGHYRLPRNAVISILMAFVCVIGVLLTNAQINGVERQIVVARRQLNAMNEDNRNTEGRIHNHFTIEEVEYLAIMHLGMAPPDASQIIEINVPAQSHVEFNRAPEILPRENYFWADIRQFAGGLMDRVFGG